MRNDIIFKRSVQFRDENKNSWTVDFEVYKEESTRINRETLQKFKQSFSVSVCGAGGMGAGQCYDHIIPRTEGQKKLLEFWNKYHLGGMSGGTIRQDEYLNGEQYVNDYNYFVELFKTYNEHYREQFDDISFQIAEFARLSGITRIVIGRSAAKKKGVFAGTSLVEKLIDHAPEMEIYIIPDSQMGPEVIRKWNRLAQKNAFSFKAAVKSAGILFAATAVGWLFEKLKLTDANIITVYILGVLLISIVTEGWFYSFSSTIASVLIFNFLFTAPRFTLRAYDRSYPFTFAVMFLAALITGSLASRLKQHAGQAARDAYRLKVLLDTNQLLQQAKGKTEILEGAAQQIVKLLKRETVIYDVKDGKLEHPLRRVPQGEEDITIEDEACEEQAAAWALENNRHAGTGTDHFKQAKRQYLAIRVNSTVYGVVGIMIQKQPLDAFENSVLLSILGECALALENDKNVREKEEAAILAKNEQLRANLLRTISHDLRTPLTSISGNANNLLYNESCLDAQMRRQIYGDIYDDSMWLIDLVENLLSVTRIEEGRMQIRQSAELVDEVIKEALKHTGQSRTGRTIKVEEEDELILAKMDARLIVQVLINLIGNAVKYTPQGTDITVRVKKEKAENAERSQVIISVCDLGNGIPDDRKERVFDMFYTGSDQVADSRRSLGLGLGLCRSIINAHGGKIWISDNIPHGAVVTFTLPAEEVALNE